MPILFVHGVNTRNSDKDYYRSVAARKTMFEKLVVPALKNPGFTVADDVYWGDLGVRFGWGLASIPSSDLQSLGGPVDGNLNADLLALLADAADEIPPTDLQALGTSDPPAVAAVKAKRPGDLVRAMLAPAMLSYDPIRPNPAPGLDAAAQSKLKTEGEGLALLMIATERVAEKVNKNPELLAAAPGTSVLDKIAAAARAELNSMSPAPRETDVQGLGGIGDFVSKPLKWAGEQIGILTNAAKATVQRVKDTSARGASLLVLKGARDDLSRKGLRFLGDVFEYLHRGRAVPPSISERVTDAVKAAAATATERSEPFVLVTHSFGAMIVYDALASGRLNESTVDLWITAGAQTSLFAEMALFQASAPLASGAAAPKALGKPANVGRWLNFYDAADVLSYLHEPVFGTDAVTDISVRDGANLSNAHGHYFLAVSFYERIAQELRALETQ
jgi:alpha-beta hydrolase superfamily lysophospholipase